MKTYLIDSDVLIDFFKRLPAAVELIHTLGEQGKSFISAISVAELRSGWTREDASIYLPRLYNIFEVMSVDKEIAEDEERRLTEAVQKLTDKFIVEADQLLSAKETDLMAI